MTAHQIARVNAYMTGGWTEYTVDLTNDTFLLWPHPFLQCFRPSLPTVRLLHVEIEVSVL